ncbi:MAG: DAK2 domain-containing protein, partial [Actinobacteria bacterium]|nr:DAK2 domain-containing protein [Actinomycetota bacterium]
TMFNEIDNRDLKKVIDIIIENFKENEEKINDMNVFPVPDGDTGTNMLLTLNSIKEELLKVKDFSVKSVLEKASFGALMGARGNSGVIFSQILKGFFDIILKSDSLNLDVIKEALKSSKDLAYDSVQDPTEGTMLTTVKDICEFVDNLTNNTDKIRLIELLDKIIYETEKSVERTTFLLPILKKAGVVDAGAQGILDILIGARKAFIEINSINGKLERNLSKAGSVSSASGSIKNNKSRNNSLDKVSKAYVPQAEGKRLKEVKMSYEIKYTYCTEFMVRGSRIDIERLRERIESFGDSALVVGNENLVKIHVHTNYPYKVLRRALREGTLHDIQINNMEDQRKEAAGEAEPVEEKMEERRALIAVANGDELEGIFKSIGVDIIVSGGQSMNPSTYDIVKAINSTEAVEVIIFPNNKNIILTANQAKKIVRNKSVYIVPTKNIPAGISAILSYNPDSGMEENKYNMEEAAQKTKNGEITQAVRDANLIVGKIKKGEYIGLSDGKVRVISNNVVDAIIDLVRDIASSTEEVITLYTGKDAIPEDNEIIKIKLKKYFPKMDIEMYKGGQPLYPYIFSIE